MSSRILGGSEGSSAYGRPVTPSLPVGLRAKRAIQFHNLYVVLLRVFFGQTSQSVDTSSTHGENIAAEHFRSLLVSLIQKAPLRSSNLTLRYSAAPDRQDNCNDAAYYESQVADSCAEDSFSPRKSFQKTHEKEPPIISTSAIPAIHQNPSHLTALWRRRFTFEMLTPPLPAPVSLQSALQCP